MVGYVSIGLSSLTTDSSISFALEGDKVALRRRWVLDAFCVLCVVDVTFEVAFEVANVGGRACDLCRLMYTKYLHIYIYNILILHI